MAVVVFLKMSNQIRPGTGMAKGPELSEWQGPKGFEFPTTRWRITTWVKRTTGKDSRTGREPNTTDSFKSGRMQTPTSPK